MKPPKCANCGAQMLETFFKNGLRLYICPHVTTKQINAISGKFYYAEIHCGLIIDGLRASFEKLMSEYNSQTTVKQLRKATRFTVSDSKLLENANLGVMLGLPADDLPALFEAAYKLGLAMGTDVNYAIDSLCRGIGRRSRLILDNIGIAFKAQEAYEWFAKANDKQTKDLTETERTTAWQSYAIQMIKDKVSIL